MSAKPWYAWFPADYKAKTSHLTFLQDGAYRRLLDAYYEHRGPLPADRQALYRIAGAQDNDERQAVDLIAGEFFTNGDGKLKHARCDEQIDREDALHKKWSDAGTEGNKKRWGSDLNSIGRRSLGDRVAIGRRTIGDSGGDRIPNPNPNTNPDPNSPKAKSNPLARRDAPLLAGEGPTIEKIPSTKGEFEIRKSHADELERLYPAVDVAQTLREIRAWNIANPDKRKTPRGILRHVNTWMEKVQNGS